jgi:hypothetical protein
MADGEKEEKLRALDLHGSIAILFAREAVPSATHYVSKI